MHRDPKTTHNVLPHKILHLVGNYLCNWLNFDPLGEVLDHHNKVFHLTYRQRERTRDVYSPGMERPRAINRPQLLNWCAMPINMLLTLLTTLCILHAILLHDWPIIPSSDDRQRESSSSNVATTNALMELDQYAGTLISIYACEDWMGITMKKEVPIY